MAEKLMRLSQAARKLNVGISTIADFLGSKGIEIDANPNTKIDDIQFGMLIDEFAASLKSKLEADERNIGIDKSEKIVIEEEKKPTEE